MICRALGRWRQEDLEFEASLGYVARLCLKSNHKMIKTSSINVRFSNICRCKLSGFEHSHLVI